jgi:hypothetical protein
LTHPDVRVRAPAAFGVYLVVMAQLRTLEIGQRFRGLASTPGRWMPTWEVAEIFTSRIDGVEYARVRAVNDPGREKTIAVSALLDPRLHVEERPAPHGGPDRR